MGATVTLRRDIPRRRGPRWHAPLRIVGQVIFMAILTGALIVCGVLGVGGAVSAGEDVVWGTFSETDCTPARYGCRSVGTWISDDGSIRKTAIHLDGRPGPDGTARAAYRPHGFNNDDENNIVHVEMLAYAWVWAPWILMVVFAGIGLFYYVKWWSPSRSRRRRSSTP